MLVPFDVVFCQYIVPPAPPEAVKVAGEQNAPPPETETKDGELTVNACCADTVPPQPPVIVYTILHVPAATAVTTPVDELTVATAELLLDHDPEPPLNTTEFAE